MPCNMEYGSMKDGRKGIAELRMREAQVSHLRRRIAKKEADPRVRFVVAALTLFHVHRTCASDRFLVTR